MSMKISQGLGDVLLKANSIGGESVGKGDSSKGSKKKLKKTASVLEDPLNSSMLTRGDSSMKNKRSSNATINKKADSFVVNEDQPV